jgi:hypothetical protein
MTVPKWSELRRMGTSRVFQSSYLWLVIVPLAAKTIQRFDLGVELPFSWRMFFLSALTTSVANVLYVWKAPAFVRRFENYAQYLAEGRTASEVSRWFESLLQRHGRQLQGNEWKNVREYVKIADPSTTLDPKNLADAVSAIESVTMPDTVASRAFWQVYNLGDDLHRNYRATTAAAYGLGIVLFSLVMIQNVWFVVKPWWLEVISYAG